MEEDAHKRIVEIKGVKMEVDLRTAKQIDEYRVGDRVKVLIKRYGDNYDCLHGVIAAFDNFEALPTITICYIDGGELKFAYLNDNSTDVEMAPAQDDVLIEKADVLRKMDREIENLHRLIEDLEWKKRYFEERFQTWFKDFKEEEVEETA